jgi:pimeloyl-ACP methyl ester carboxylesterase
MSLKLVRFLLLCTIGWLLGWLALAPALALAETSACELRTARLVLEDGHALAYREAGQGPPVVLLHGLFASKEQWADFQCQLAAAGHTTIAPDLPGYGKSQGFPLADYRVQAQAERLRQFTEHLGLDNVDLVGNSLGGTVAAIHAQRHPRQVRTLALIGGPFGLVPWGPKVEAAIEQGINPFIPVTLAELDLELSLLFVTPPDLPDADKNALLADSIANQRHSRQVWDIVNLDDRILAQQVGDSPPTFVLWGQADHIFAAEDGIQRMRQRDPKAEWQSPPGVGHLPHLEQPEQTAEAYLAFLRAH